jgi:hypothetical protein
MFIDAATAILPGGDILPARDVPKLAGFSSTIPSVQPS